MTHGVSLRPLSVGDEQVMAGVLADPSLYEFTGGEPPTVEQLRRRYTAQLLGGPADGSEQWVNRVVLQGRRPVGYVQATLPSDGAAAEIAWVIGRPWQGRGYAWQAAVLLLEELASQGVRQVTAHIHPAHAASGRVAERLGLGPTSVVVEGENRWMGTIRPDRPRIIRQEQP